MSEDKKVFYTKSMNLDTTNLGRAINTLDSIKGRWVALKPEIEWIGKFLRSVKDLLKLGGWEGYSPDYQITIPDLKVKLPNRRQSEKGKIAKDLESLPKRQANRDENIKSIYGRLDKLSEIHQKLIVAIATREEMGVEKLIKRELTIEEKESITKGIIEKTETFRGEY